MKTISQIGSTPTSGRDKFIVGPNRQFPQFSSSFHSDIPSVSAPHRAELRRFRKLSAEFFRRETPRDYAKELTLFGIIIAVSAWPVLMMLRALGDLLK